MPYFVRCIEGHVFDADISAQCPTCGAFVDVPTPLPATAAPSQPATKSPILASPGASIAATQTNAPPMGAAILGRLSGSVLLIVLISALLGIAGVGIAYFLFRPANWPPQFAQRMSPVPASAKATVSKAPLPVVEATKPTATSKIEPSNVAPANPTPASTAPASPPVVEVEIASTIELALTTARMETLYQQRDYVRAATIARDLAAKDNAIALFILGALQTGVMGPENPSEARKQFTAAAALGDVRSAVIAANMIGRGLGGPQDVQGAEALYFYAARNGAPDAERELALLHLSAERGITVSEAYNNLMAGKNVDEFWRLMNEMIAAHSPPATCLAGWLYGHGNSTPRDLNRALDLFKAGAAIANPSCLLGLARIAATGIPQLPRDPVASDVLLHLAARVLGPKSSQGLDAELAALESKMSAADRAKAEELYQSSIPPAAATRNPALAAHP